MDNIGIKKGSTFFHTSFQFLKQSVETQFCIHHLLYFFFSARSEGEAHLPFVVFVDVAADITFILYGHKSHDLSELMNAAKKHTPEIFKAFPRDTPEEKRLFDLLQRAYIESRYNPDFEITKADIDALLPKIELLRDVVEQVCNERLAYYDSRIEK